LVTTTPDAIVLAAETAIEAMDPAGGEPQGAGLETTYRKVSAGVFAGSPEALAESDLDRQYAIGPVLPKRLVIQGVGRGNLIEATVDVVVGHQIGGDYGVSRDRQGKDILQIISQLVIFANRPAGVCWIRFVDSTFQVVPGGSSAFWWTTLTFALQYYANNNYGG
jgi:hypothetical protein